MATQLKLALIAATALIIVSLIVGHVVLGIFGADRYDVHRQSYDVKTPGIYVVDRLTGSVQYCTKAGCWPLSGIERPELKRPQSN
jgi:hypothetical protein